MESSSRKGASAAAGSPISGSASSAQIPLLSLALAAMGPALPSQVCPPGGAPRKAENARMPSGSWGRARFMSSSCHGNMPPAGASAQTLISHNLEADEFMAKVLAGAGPGGTLFLP